MLTPVRRGVVDAAHAGTGIADVGHGRVPTVEGRPRLFKSVRMAWADLVIASAARLWGARDRAASGANRPAG